MKKILGITTLTLIFLLVGCKQPIECGENQKLEGDTCVDIVPECKDNEKLENGVCVEIIPEKSELEKAFENSINADNYKMVITITEGDVTVDLTLHVDGNTSSLEVGNEIEYFVNDNGTCERVTVQLGTTITETVDCISAEDKTYQFFHGFKMEQFEESGENYKLKDNNYALLTNFFRNAFSDAVVSNFVLVVDNDYFNTFTFDVSTGDTTYNFEMTLSLFEEVSITVPE